MPTIISSTAQPRRLNGWAHDAALERAASADVMVDAVADPSARAGTSRSSPAIMALERPWGAPGPSALERLPASARREGDARWFTSPPLTSPPLAFYGTVEGRTSYFEIDLTQCDPNAVMEVLRQTCGLLALQLPEQGMSAAMLRLLIPRCSELECLRLPSKSATPAEEVVRLLGAVEERLQALALGGRSEVFESPQLAAAAIPFVKRMTQLKYLDLCDGAANWQPSTHEVKALLADKQLRGLCIAGNMQVDCAALLGHPALRTLECLDMRRCTPKPGWFSPAGKRLVSAVVKMRQLRVLQMPPLPQWEDDAKPLAQLMNWAGDQDLAFLRIGQGTAPLTLYTRGENAALDAAANLPPESWLQTFANWDPHFAEVGRWIPPPRERWDSIDLCKRGAVYILRELAALRGMGYAAHVVEHRFEMEVNGPVYRLHWKLDTGHTFCVTVRPDELNLALDRLPIAKQVARQNSLVSLSWLTASATSTQLAQAALTAA